ncbi:unnamed protein product [Rotaria socialis]|uniref:Uncharacterized protein n=1 Tax=Rotaria socialis TaxID=392032 RepID=A0A817L2M9_9BILA|nr:unnamed protein product [Rotaria socialis]
MRCISTLAEVIKHRLNVELDSIRKAENSKDDLLNFCANNYLSLANNREIITTAKQALDDCGSDLSSDELNHVSIIDGIRLCKAKRLRYKHKDMSDLALKLKESFNENNDNLYSINFYCWCLFHGRNYSSITRYKMFGR